MMTAKNYRYLLDLEEYLHSGHCPEDFMYSPEERRHEMLAFLEKLMELGELADETATRIIFRKSNEENAD